MSDAIKALEALRDVVRANGRSFAAACDIDRAIADLRAEEPKACAKQDPFAPYGEMCVLPVGHTGHHSAHPWSAHPQPAPAEVPRMPERIDTERYATDVYGTFPLHQVRALHAAAVRLHTGLEAMKVEYGKAMEADRQNQCALDEARTQLAEAQAALREVRIIPDAVDAARLKQARAEERERCVAKMRAKLNQLYDRYHGDASRLDTLDEEGFPRPAHEVAKARYIAISTATAAAIAAIRATPEEVE